MRDMIAVGRDEMIPDSSFLDVDLVAVTEGITAAQALHAYGRGAFLYTPYGTQSGLGAWWSPDPRFVIPVSPGVRLGRTLRKLARRRPYRITIDVAYDAVVHGCAVPHAPLDPGTWLCSTQIRVFRELHRLGVAHSAEAWVGDRLVGGLFGVVSGAVFYGVSMFSIERCSSSLALAVMAEELRERGTEVIDCGFGTRHLGRLGGDWIPREQLLELLGPDLGVGPGRWIRLGSQQK